VLLWNDLGTLIACRERFCVVADRATSSPLLLRGLDRPKEKRTVISLTAATWPVVREREWSTTGHF
jgi:hypothetical protein